jgi:hypothetical protein
VAGRAEPFRLEAISVVGPAGRSVVWVLEREVFPESHEAMRSAVEASGAEVLPWRDEWWGSGACPPLEDRVVVFHGSLGNAERVRRELPWRPGSLCDTEKFRCSAWYPRAEPWLLHRKWKLTTVQALVADSTEELAFLDGAAEAFVRPDSPLKPFSGRVVRRDRLSLEALDHGYHYVDATLPVVVAPVRPVGREWRYVVVARTVVAGSGYTADRLGTRPDDPNGEAWRYAQDVARALAPPEAVYVLDLCEVNGALHLLELNPFSGADLYACDRRAVVTAVSTWAEAHRGQGARDRPPA